MKIRPKDTVIQEPIRWTHFCELRILWNIQSGKRLYDLQITTGDNDAKITTYTIIRNGKFNVLTCDWKAEFLQFGYI